jgi:hypothetical protein
VNQGKNAGHQAWLRRWLGDPITVRVTYREHWWDGDDSEDPNEDSGYVQYMIRTARSNPMRRRTTIIPKKSVTCPRCGKVEPDLNELAYHQRYECRG